MAILNHANHLPLNLEMGNLLLGTKINFLIAIVKIFKNKTTLLKL